MNTTDAPVFPAVAIFTTDTTILGTGYVTSTSANPVALSFTWDTAGHITVLPEATRQRLIDGVIFETVIDLFAKALVDRRG